MPPAVPPPTIVLGEEELLADRAVAAAVEEAVRALGEGTVVEQVRAGALPEGFVLGLSTLSLFGGGRVLVVEDAHELDQQARAALLDAAGDAGGGTVLVLRAPGTGRQARFFEELGRSAKVVRTPKLRPAERTRWLKSELRARDRKADERAVATLLELTGGNLRTLAGAVAKLHVAVPPPAPITAADVQEHLSRTAERGIFDLTDAVLAGDLQSGLGHLAALLDQGEDPIGLLSMLARQLRTLLRVADHPGAPAAGVARLLGGGVRDWQVERARRQLRRWQPEQLRRGLAAIAEADVEIRSGALPGRLAVELVVAHLARPEVAWR
ncbi:MAG TPA: DNA polymerase III subunit delta [Actinomycetes bacterium]|nr:DNA polymerase III subunit delta [Actinomycetes bacterium]